MERTLFRQNPRIVDVLIRLQGRMLNLIDIIFSRATWWVVALAQIRVRLAIKHTIYGLA